MSRIVNILFRGYSQLSTARGKMVLELHLALVFILAMARMCS